MNQKLSGKPGALQPSWGARANRPDPHWAIKFFAGVSLSYWIDQPPSASNLRLFQSDGAWLAWDDREEDGKTRRGARGQVEERLLLALNATNLMALLGSGASFAAKNADGKQAPGMGDLWDDSRQKVGEDDFDKVVAEVWGATDKKDIESLVWMPRGVQGHYEPLERVIECALVSGL